MGVDSLLVSAYRSLTMRPQPRTAGRLSFLYTETRH